MFERSRIAHGHSSLFRELSRIVVKEHSGANGDRSQDGQDERVKCAKLVSLRAHVDYSLQLDDSICTPKAAFLNSALPVCLYPSLSCKSLARQSLPSLLYAMLKYVMRAQCYSNKSSLRSYFTTMLRKNFKHPCRSPHSHFLNLSYHSPFLYYH